MNASDRLPSTTATARTFVARWMATVTLLHHLKIEITMLVTKLVTRLLWAFGYPSFAPLSGKFDVGAIQTRLPDSVSCQIHYPVNSSTKRQSDCFPYFRPQAMEGLADYSRTNPTMLRSLYLKRHPCWMNAEPMTDRKFPLLLFSHGLGGCMEMYTELCQQIASHGFVVVALEHEDGSGAYAETALGKPILYKRPDDTPYSRQKVLDFRRPFLKQRVQETTDVLDIILNKQDATGPEVKRVLSTVDTSEGISLVGHSFGGATMVLAAQKYLAEANINPNFVPKSLSLFDVWAFSLEEKALNQGVDLPTLSILSEGWVLTNPEVQKVDQFLQNCPKESSFFIPRSGHASFSDAVGWLPRVLGRKLNLVGKQEKRHDTIPTAAKACVQHIQSALNNDDCNAVTTSELLQMYGRNSANAQKEEDIGVTTAT